MSASDNAESKGETMEAGLQPLDSVMRDLGLQNHDLVSGALPATLTHKMVAKGRRGRRLTWRTQEKIVRALNAAARGEREYRYEDCFNYEGR